jgi:tRNA modification GTPase
MIDARQVRQVAEKSGSVTEAPVWLVRNKIDLVGSAVTDRATRPSVGGVTFDISASRGDGIADLMAALVAFANDYFGPGEGALIGRERQRKLLDQTAVSLERSISVLQRGEEFAAEELRVAANSLGRLLGRVDVEDILDVIFRDFCIGK